MTNALKAQIIVSVNALLGLIVLFGVPLTTQQQAGITLFVNSVLAIYVGMTYKRSPKRLPESLEKVEAAGGGERLRVKGL